MKLAGTNDDNPFKLAKPKPTAADGKPKFVQ